MESKRERMERKREKEREWRERKRMERKRAWFIVTGWDPQPMVGDNSL